MSNSTHRAGRRNVTYKKKTCFFWASIWALILLRSARPPTHLHAPYFYAPCTLAPCSASAMRMLTPWEGPDPPKPHLEGSPRDPTQGDPPPPPLPPPPPRFYAPRGGGKGPFGPLGPLRGPGGPLIRNVSYSEWDKYNEKTFVRILPKYRERM